MSEPCVAVTPCVHRLHKPLDMVDRLGCLPMFCDDAQLSVDRSCLQDQYRNDANLSARQSIYAYQHPTLDLPQLVLEVAALNGTEVVADIGCGNGIYLTELTLREHSGPLVAVDLSAGMLNTVRKRVPTAALLVADAVALPLQDQAVDLTLAMHMLYHVPDARIAVVELRRITRAGGKVMVTLNGSDHLSELRELINAEMRARGRRVEAGIHERLCIDQGEEMLASVFTSIIRYDFTATLLIPNRLPVEKYVRSLVITQNTDKPRDFAAAVADRIPIRHGGVFRVRTHIGCFICS